MTAKVLFWGIVLWSSTFTLCTSRGDGALPVNLPVGGSVGHALSLTCAANLRDIGGYEISGDTSVARGLVFRSDVFNPMSEADKSKLKNLGLKFNYDLRTQPEVKAQPDEMPAGISYVHFDVLADEQSAAPAQLEALLRDPKKASVELGSGKIEALFADGYRKFVSLPSAKKAYRELFLSLSDQSKLPAVFHCTTGKDRTGWATAALLSLLGVPRETVFTDYLRTNDYLLPYYEKQIDGFVAAGGNRAIPMAIFGVKREYLEAAFDEMQRNHGSIDKYFSEGLGIDVAGQLALRELLTVQSSASSAGNEPVFASGYPTDAASTQLYDEMDYQRACQAYIWATPLVNSVGVDRGERAVGSTPEKPMMIVIDKPLSPKQVFMTGNDISTYGLSCIDLGTTGPFVVDAPEGILGGIVDFWQRAVIDIGVGETLHGAKLLLLPPGYEGNVPAGYTAVRCKTKRVFLLARGTPQPGEGPDGLVKLLGSVGLYPLAQKDAPTTTKTIRVGGVPIDTDWPKDYRFFEYLADGLSDVIVEPQDKLMYAMIEPLGLAPGKPFNPDERQRKILTRAAETGHQMVANMAFANRFPGRQVWPEREWEKLTFATTPDFETAQRTELDERAQGWYQLAMNARYAYTAKPTPGEGSWYTTTFHDGSGAYLVGGNTYKLHVAPNVPAKAFWSVTIYDNRSRSMIDTDQQRAGRGSLSDLTKNADGSIDIYFSPAAPQGFEKNWIKTIPGQGFFAMFRLYGPLEPVFDGTWKLADVKKVN